jgi:hypothetical protein
MLPELNRTLKHIGWHTLVCPCLKTRVILNSGLDEKTSLNRGIKSRPSLFHTTVLSSGLFTRTIFVVGQRGPDGKRGFNT